MTYDNIYKVYNDIFVKIQRPAEGTVLIVNVDGTARCAKDLKEILVF
jgi:hypothetical protein